MRAMQAAVERIIAIEQRRGEIARTERSALTPKPNRSRVFPGPDPLPHGFLDRSARGPRSENAAGENAVIRDGESTWLTLRGLAGGIGTAVRSRSNYSTIEPSGEVARRDLSVATTA